MAQAELSHAEEVKRGERFEFGKNWSRFLSTLNEDRIRTSEGAIRSMLGVVRLDGKTFLDIGSGSGLSSLAARRLGAKVCSFDYDPDSVACTRELRRRYFTDDPDWTVSAGSALDQEFLGGLGEFDIVYSWGVLHHTGKMWQALENVKSLVRPGGVLFVAIYNDQGAPTDKWERIKKTYNELPAPLALAYASSVIARSEAASAVEYARQGDLREWLKTLTEYGARNTRGMSRWHDWIDMIGGWPYERATLEQIADFYAADGFRLESVVDRSWGHGCNEFVFTRVADRGVFVPAPLRAGNTMARRYGVRLVGPLSIQDGTARLAAAVALRGDGQLHLFHERRLLTPVERSGEREVVFPADALRGLDEKAVLHVVAGRRLPLAPPFERGKGRTWSKALPDLAELSDSSEEPRRSRVFLLEDDVQAASPHALHADIAKLGGHFSFWNGTLLFSTSDGGDPHAAPQRYAIFVADETSA